MIIQQWQINQPGNTEGHSLPAGWQLIAHELHVADDKTYVAVCAYLDSSLKTVCALEDFSPEDFKVDFQDTPPITLVREVIEPLLDTKYGELEWSRV